MDIFSPTILDDALITGSNNASLLQVSSPSAVSAFFISGSGNVGIGTATPQRTLDVNGSIRVDTIHRGGGASNLSFLTDGNGAVTLNIGGAIIGTSYDTSPLFNEIRTSNNQNLSINARGSGSLFLQTVDTTRLTITGSNVGIGTTSPSAQLHISGSATTPLRIQNPATTLMQISSSAANSGSIVFFGTTPTTTGLDLEIQSNGAVNGGQVRIAGNGTQWDFGSVSAVARNGTGNSEMFSATMTGTSTTLVQNPVRIQFNANQSSAGGGGYTVLRLNATHATTAGTGSKLLQTWEFGGVAQSVMDISGSLGIGTGSAPSARLFISGANTDNLLRVSSPTNTNILFVTGSGLVGIRTTTPGTELDVSGDIRASNNVYASNLRVNSIFLNTGTFLRFLSASIETARYDNNGWGFFNTAPTAKLHISGANADNLFRVSSPSATDALFVSGSGNVGIGTASPTERLHVDGNLLVTGRITAEEFHTEFVSASIIYQSGSTQFGNSSDDIHQFTGSLSVNGSITGSLFGTSSWAESASNAVNAQTASFLPIGTYSITSSQTINAQTASNITPSITNNTDNRVLTATGGGTINGETNLTFDGSVLTVTGRANISTSITSSTATIGFGTAAALNAGQTTIRGSGVDTVGALTIQNSGGTGTFTVLNGGTTGVGENNPSARLHVKGSGATSATTALRVENSSAAARLTILDDGTSAFNTSHLYVSSSGNVGIGTTTPQRELDVNGAIRVNTIHRGGGSSTLNILTDNSSAARINIGGALIGTLYDTNPNTNEIRTTNNQNLSINARGSGSLFLQTTDTTRLTITGSNVGIGTTTPTNTLQVVGGITATSITASIISASSGITGSLFGTSSWATNALTASFVTTLNQNVLVTGSLTIGATSLGANENTLVIGPAPAGGTGEGGQILLQSPGGIYTSASMWDNYQNLTRLLRGTNAVSDAVVSAFNMHTKQMQLPAYNSTTAFVGTVAGVLGFDSSGNILTTTTSGASPAFPFTGSAQITGSLSVTGPISSTAAITSTANNQMYFRGGDDAEFWDINIANTVGIYGQQNASVASIKLGSGGGIISGQSSSIGINTTSPTARLHVSGASADSLLRVGSPTDSNILFVTGSGNVGIHTSAPTQWIYLSTTPSTGKYLNIDAAQTSNNPPDYGAGGGGGVDRIIGNTLDNFALGTPDYWMEIKLNGGIVLIPAYLPA